MKRLIVMSIAVLITAIVVAAPKKVACIGNSITYGFLVDNRTTNNYPAQLQRLLGDDYKVGNFGKSGATLLRKGHRPYNEQDEFRAALEFRPDIAVIHLGVNDTDPRNWPNFADEFAGDYLRLIDTLRSVNPKVRIIMARLTPLSARHYRFKSGTRDWRLQIQQVIENIATKAGAELIDFDAVLRDRQNLMPDGIHPDVTGAGVLAQTVYSGITGNYGGLQLPAIYQSGMVLQRNQPLRISGRADAGSAITLTLDGRTYRTSTDNRGHWQVLTVPLITGTGYELTVTDGTDTIRHTDIMAGEVWLASGQSNMEFGLAASKGGKEAVAQASDPMMRIFDMKPVARTNNCTWPDSVLEAVNDLRYFKPAHWQAISPENAGDFSAVAYYFARQLRDSLDIPVGIISNGVGGAPAEAWIDVNYLERDIPEILLNWLDNDYVQKWAQGRARTNMGPDNTAANRHPYEPSYLFSAAIRQLAGFRIAGVIWYQGESNAHNIEVHERLFPLLVESWRNNFNYPEMPVYFVQLSSIDRPSWPQFRDSQRRMALSIPHTGMAVSSDVGDSLDVHPTDKRPVGERLARQALLRTYGRTTLSADGPRPSSAIARNGSVTIVMADGHGLHTSDNKAPATFEIAEIDGFYKPAIAEIINDNEIKIYNMDIKKPRFVRYGWQPFTRANIVNADNLPASTFRIEVDNASVYDHEAGIEAGVSACFATMLDDRLIMAGGCNFPTDPMAAGSQKKFYKGIYAATPGDMKWEKIGELPEATAYGATATTPLGAVLIGGTTAEKSLNTVWLLNVDANGTPEVEQLPSLPATVDNMAACAIGNKIYVAGGNTAGAPSTELLMLDLDDKNSTWKRLRPMPGNPRVQPAMAAGTDNKETCLFLWGGFAGKGPGREATLETAGLKYTPSKNKWERIEAPTDRLGNEVSVGGGAACTLVDGRIAVAGGVNKDIFLEALRNQAPDYLQHPIEWYRFNPNILIFDPATGEWQVEAENAGAARAGAAIVAGTDHDFYLIGGELKPRIRTAETLHVTEIRHH